MLRKLGGRSVPATPRSAQQQSTPIGGKEKSYVDHGYKHDVAHKANQGTATDSREAAINHATHQWLPLDRVLSLLDGFAYTLLIDSERRALLRAKGLCKQLVNAEDYELINIDSKGPSILDDSGSSVLAYMSWGMEHFEKAAACRSKEARVELLDKAEPMLSSLTRSMDAQGWTGGCSSSRHVPNAVLLGLAHLYLALIWKLRLNAVTRVATHILQVFIVCPKYARLSFAPELWAQLFKPPLAGVEAWYRKEYNTIAGYSKSLSAFVRSSPCSPINALDDDDEDYNHRHQNARRASADINSRLLMASVEKKRADKIKMQINLLYELYEETLDEGTQKYALHYQELISKGSLGNESRGKGLYNRAANQQSNRRGLTSNVDESKSTSNIAMESKSRITQEMIEVTTGNLPDTGGQRPSFDASESIPDAAASSTSIWTFGSGKPLQLRRSLYQAIFGAVFHSNEGKSSTSKSGGRPSTYSTSAAATPGSFLRLCNKELPQVHLHVNQTSSINVSSNPVSLSKLQATRIGFEGRRPAAKIPEDTELDVDHIRGSNAADYVNYTDEDDPRKCVAAGSTMRSSSTKSGSDISLRELSSSYQTVAPSCPPASSTVVPDREHRATSASNDGGIKPSARLVAARNSPRLIDLIGDSESETSRTDHHPNIRPVLTALHQSSAAKARTQGPAGNSKKISSGLDGADQKTPAADVVAGRRSRRSSFSSGEGPPMRERERLTAGQPRSSSFYNSGDQYRRGSRDARKKLVETAQLIREGKHIVLLQPASHHRSQQIKKGEEAGSLNKSSSSAERSDGSVRQWNNASGRMRRLQPRQLQYSTAARGGSGMKDEEEEEEVVEKAVVDVCQDRKTKKEEQDMHMAPSKALNEEREMVDQSKCIRIDALGEDDQCMEELVQELREEVRAAKQGGGSVEKCEEVLLRLSQAWLECKKKSKPLKHREEEYDDTGAHMLHQLGQVVDELLYILATSKLPEAQRLSLCLLSTCNIRSRSTTLSNSHIHDDFDGSSTVTKTAVGSPQGYNNSTHDILSVALSHLLQQPGRLPEAALLLNLFHPCVASRHLPLLLPLLMDIIIAEYSKPGSSGTGTSHPGHDPAALASSINSVCNRSTTPLVSLDAQLPPRSLALKIVSHLLSAADPSSRLSCCRHHLLSSPRALPCLLQSLQRSCRSSTAASLDECVAAASILTTCIQCSLEASSRHRILAQVEASSLVALLQRTAGTVAAFQTAVGFVTEVLYCSRRAYWVDILGGIRHDGLLNCMHALMAYLQSASLEQQPPAAGLLLQMDLLAVKDGRQRRYSVFRDEALDSLVAALNSDRTIDMEASLSAARTLARMAGSALVHSERSVSALVASHDVIHCHQQGVLEAWLLKRAGVAGQYDSVCNINSNSKMRRNNSKSSSGQWSPISAISTNSESYNQELPTINELSGEQERSFTKEAAADVASMQWDGKLALALLDHGGPLFLALAKHLRAVLPASSPLSRLSPSSSASSSSSSVAAASELRKVCLVLVAWLTCYLGGAEPVPTRNISFVGAPAPAGRRAIKPPNNSMYSKSAAHAASMMREAVASQLHAAVMASYNHDHRRGGAAGSGWAIDERIFAALALKNLGEEDAAPL